MKKLLAILLAATMCVTLLAACGGQSNDTADTNGDTAATDTNDTKTDANADMIYAVETGSAGEAAAKEKGWEINSVAAQADALMEVEAGTSDAAIVDLLMATAMTGEGTSYPDLTYDAEQKLTTEEYGIGCRKGSDLAAFINNVLAETYADGSMKKVADTYKLADAMVEQAAPDANYTVPTDGDVAYIQNKGKLVVGITDFAQGQLGDIVFVDVPTVGESLGQNEVFGSIEAVKTVSDAFLPVSGEILEFNEALENDPALVNKDPYGEGWIIKVNMANPAEVDTLLSADDYAKLVG